MWAEMCGCLQNVHLHRALKSLNPGYLRSGSCVFQITPLEFTAYGQAHPASLGLKSAMVSGRFWINRKQNGKALAPNTIKPVYSVKQLLLNGKPKY